MIPLDISSIFVGIGFRHAFAQSFRAHKFILFISSIFKFNPDSSKEFELNLSINSFTLKLLFSKKKISFCISLFLITFSFFEDFDASAKTFNSFSLKSEKSASLKSTLYILTTSFFLISESK